MEVYFVRHGETVANRSHRHQPEHTRLTVHGEAQARDVAEELVHLSPTHLIASSQVRAVETAEIITETIDLIPEVNELFCELKRPDSVYGWSHRGARSFCYLFCWYFGWVRGCNDGSGESHAEFRARLLQARDYLATLPEEARVVVVSHSVFMNFFVAHMCQTKRLSLRQAYGVLRAIFATKNTQILHLQYQPRVGQCGWQQVVD